MKRLVTSGRERPLNEADFAWASAIQGSGIAAQVAGKSFSDLLTVDYLCTTFNRRSALDKQSGENPGLESFGSPI